MGLLNRKKLLEKEKLQVVKVDLGKDETNEEIYVFVKQMTGHERDIFETSLRREIRDKQGKLKDMDLAIDDFRAKLAVASVCDEEGNLLLNKEDYKVLSQSFRLVFL